MAEQRVKRRLAAILAADVVGYSPMMREDEGMARRNADIPEDRRIEFRTRLPHSSATRSTDNSLGGSFLHW